MREDEGIKMSLRLRMVGCVVAAMAASWPLAVQSQTARPGSAAQSPAASGAPAAASALEPGEIFRDCPECSEMVVIPSGEFKMGGEETVYEKPSHRVVFANNFAIGRREVTFEEWDQCVDAGGCKYRATDQGWGRGDRPVINVSWEDAKAFVGWLSQKTGKPYRLPSEAEWEYAARAGTESSYWWGRTLVKGNANCEDCTEAPAHKTLPAQSFRPNGFGLFDVAGNAAEWVEDCWNDNYRGAPANGVAWTTGQCQWRGLRGGSFANKATTTRSAARFRYDVDVRYYANGFRVARDLK
jgi:formylglycine-generating enzyme required for sulfatase activity